MKNLSLYRNKIIFAVFAVGLLVFGGKSAFDFTTAAVVTVPTETPSTANLVSPTFNGVNVEGEIKNTASTGETDVVVNDALDVRGISWLKDTLVGNLTDPRMLTVFGVSFLYGEISNPATTGEQDVLINDSLDLRGELRNDNGNVIVNDFLDVRSSIKNDGTRGASGDEPVVIYDNLNIGDSVLSKLVRLFGNMNITGTIANPNTQRVFSMNPTLVCSQVCQYGSGATCDGTITYQCRNVAGGQWVDKPLPVKIANGLQVENGPLYFTSSDGSYTKTITPSSTGTFVDGKLMASYIGSYQLIQNSTTVNGNSSRNIDVGTCPSTWQVISCYANAYPSTMQWLKYGISINSDLRSCNMTVINSNPNSQTINWQSLCYNTLF